MITTQELLDYLGAGEESKQLVESMRAYALERLRRATGVDWEQAPQSTVAEEAVRTMVYLSYYAVRDGAKNTQFLEDHLVALICTLQFSEEAMNVGTGQTGGNPAPGANSK